MKHKYQDDNKFRGNINVDNKIAQQENNKMKVEGCLANILKVAFRLI